MYLFKWINRIATFDKILGIFTLRTLLIRLLSKMFYWRVLYTLSTIVLVYYYFNCHDGMDRMSSVSSIDSTDYFVWKLPPVPVIKYIETPKGVAFFSIWKIYRWGIIKNIERSFASLVWWLKMIIITVAMPMTDSRWTRKFKFS